MPEDHPHQAEPVLLRLPIDKPATAVRFLHERGGGVMDLIAHFWERLPQTPPLLRNDLHLVIALDNPDISIPCDLNDEAAFARIAGAMLFVPKAYRADVLALTDPVAVAFARYIQNVGTLDPGGLPGMTAYADPKVPIDFLTGQASGIQAMIPHLLPLVHKRAPARSITNVVMQLPSTAPAQLDPSVRLARNTDLPALNRWRKLYKEERGISFDADLDALIASQRAFVCEVSNQIVAVAKFDLELPRLIEIGGVFTFPEARQKGFAERLVNHLAARIRAQNKMPTLQTDSQNTPALQLYQKHGWTPLGHLARVWLTG